MTKHTPGPWTVDTNIANQKTVWNGEHFCIASVIQMPNGADESNARLIAAAPDLLHELERVREIVDEVDVVIIDRVLAKARGEKLPPMDSLFDDDPRDPDTEYDRARDNR